MTQQSNVGLDGLVTTRAGADGDRRRFLRMATASPLGGIFLAACGGGGDNETAGTTAPTETPTTAPTTSPTVAPTPTPTTAPTTAPTTSPTPAPTTAPTPAPTTAPTPAPTPEPEPIEFETMPPGPLPAWVAGQPLWQWFEIPNSRLATVDPVPTPLGINGPRSKIESWCGASLKRVGSMYMLGAAGGHGDYAGNEVNALALNVDSPSWVQLRAPSLSADVQNRSQFYRDGRPAATHTYYATQFIDSLNRMMVFPSEGLLGAFPEPPANDPYLGSTRAFSFDVTSGDWDSPEYVAKFPGTGDWVACLCVKHPGTGNVYYSRNYGDGFYRWTAATNTWTRVSGNARNPWYAGSAIDPRRNRMLVVGGYSPTAPQVWGLDGVVQAKLFGGLGIGPLTVVGYPGVVYEEILDRYLVFVNEANAIQIYAVNAATFEVSRPSIAGSLPESRINGVQNSVQYVPELRGVVLANRHNGNVYFMRTTA